MSNQRDFPDWTPEKLLRFIQRGLASGKINDAGILLPIPPDAAEADIVPLSDIVNAVCGRLSDLPQDSER